MFVLSCLVIDMPCLYNIGGALILVCVLCSPKHLSKWHTSRGSPSIFHRWWVCRCLVYYLYVQIPYCHQSTKKGEIVEAYLSRGSFGDWWQHVCGLIVCFEHFRDSSFGTRRFLSPLSVIQDGVALSLLFWWTSFVGVTVLSRGGPLW